ncbi:PTS transporter subunit IIC, partial [Staphylococcus aureus]|uniref:PTS transporter subunit IIC n=1 Tax=Staphylococcus aureus TaxID=1280 RepID=UPI0028CB7870
MKTILPFLILTPPPHLLLPSLHPFPKIFQHPFPLQAILPNNQPILSLPLKHFPTTPPLIILSPIILNILIPRFTNLK